MRRDPSRLTTPEFDLLIVGAGIYGATAAWDATQRGLKVALIDKGDIGGGTSFNNAKTVHGGVRSLQRGHIGEMREYLRERRALLHILPHLVHPLPFLMPTTRSLTRNRLALRTYFRVNDLLARDRNRIPDSSKHLPGSRLLSRDECLQLAPWIDPTGVTGGIEWHDAQFSNSSRAELAFVRTAMRHGLEAANYVEATSPIVSDGRIAGVMARSLLDDGHDFPIRARAILLAAGGWTDEWLARATGGRRRRPVPHWSVAMNFVIKGRGGSHAVGGDARGRLFFLAPWRSATIAGTSHDPWTSPAEHLTPRREYVDQLLSDLNVAFPNADISPGDIRLVHRGLLPATEASSERVTLMRESPFVDHAEDGCRHLYSLVGVRYTTARASAEHAVEVISRALGASVRACATATTRLDGGEIEQFDAFVSDARREAGPGLQAAAIERLVYNYGTAWRDVVACAAGGLGDRDGRLGEASQPPRGDGWLAPLGAHCEVTGAEILYAVREEMAVTLADAVLRRTETGSRGYPGDDAVGTAAEIMAAELGWSEDRTARERQDLLRAYEAAALRGT